LRGQIKSTASKHFFHFWQPWNATGVYIFFVDGGGRNHVMHCSAAAA
jgi:hypothetical protein